MNEINYFTSLEETYDEIDVYDEMEDILEKWDENCDYPGDVDIDWHYQCEEEELQRIGDF